MAKQDDRLLQLTGNWQLALSLQESGIRIDELVRLQFETP
jgi:hypothetical protein